MLARCVQDLDPLPNVIRLSSLAVSTINLVSTWYGFGTHIATLSPGSVILNLKLEFANQFVYDIGVTLPKISVLLFYARILSKANDRFRYAL